MPHQAKTVDFRRIWTKIREEANQADVDNMARSMIVDQLIQEAQPLIFQDEFEEMAQLEMRKIKIEVFQVKKKYQKWSLSV